MAASAARLDIDLVQRLDLLNAACEPRPEWLAPARAALIEGGFWLLIAALIWVAALAVL